jgi:hypothetical protein
VRIAGYAYQADTLCPTCVIEAMLASGEASPAARDMATEDALDQIAGANAIDRYDEHTYDSDDFPKVIFSTSIEGDQCGGCGEEL